MITLIFCGDLRYCPYLKRYTERLELKRIEYQVLFWNRGNLKLEIPQNYYFYNYPSDEGASFGKKMLDFYKFRKWVKNHLEKYPTNKLILLSTLTGFILFPELKNYSYIYDIRDYSYEKYFLFRKIEEKIINKSYFTCISSKGFKNFLPSFSYVIAHNFNRKEIENNKKFIKKSLPLDIVWNGTIRFFNYQKKFLDVFKNDSRFRLVYHGTGTDIELYKRYCEDNNIKNVLFTGAYNNDNKKELLKNAAILNNCYGDRTGDEIKFAISNRFYDGINNYIPQIVESTGYKASIIKKHKIGLIVEPNRDTPDILFNYYQNIDEKLFELECEKLIDNFLKEDNIYIQKIDEFIEGNVK